MTTVEEQRRALERQLGEPERLTFPEGWTTSGSWERAQRAPAYTGPANPAEFDVLLGYVDRAGFGETRRVLFTIYGGDLRAECSCDGYAFRSWCAHVAHLWWRWVRSDLGVVDLGTGRTHLSPPAWLTVEDRTEQLGASERGQATATDGGVPR
jgi:hypothetical protein